MKEGYQDFAKYYDLFTQNVNYSQRAAYFHQLFAFYGVLPQVLLDLACGTGSLSYQLAKLGYQVVGTDASVDMLAQATAKPEYDQQLPVQFLAQSMEQLQLPQPVDGVICALDSINHLPNMETVGEVFRRVYENLSPKGFFIFDVNSLYKHQEVLGDYDFIFEEPPVYCGWQNQYDPKDHRVEIVLDFFEELPSGEYLRAQEVFVERYYSKSMLKQQLEQAGFTLVDVYGEDSFHPPSMEEERLVYVSRRN